LEAFTVVIQLAQSWRGGDLFPDLLEGPDPACPVRPKRRRFALGLILALLPSVVAGLALKKLLDEYAQSSLAMPFIRRCWIVGGVMILLFERIAPAPRWFEGDKLPLSKAFQIGCCQILSIIPGVSRSGATIPGPECAGRGSPGGDLIHFLSGGSHHDGGFHPGTASLRRAN